MYVLGGTSSPPPWAVISLFILKVVSGFVIIICTILWVQFIIPRPTAWDHGEEAASSSVDASMAAADMGTVEESVNVKEEEEIKEEDEETEVSIDYEDQRPVSSKYPTVETQEDPQAEEELHWSVEEEEAEEEPVDPSLRLAEVDLGEEAVDQGEEEVDQGEDAVDQGGEAVDLNHVEPVSVDPAPAIDFASMLNRHLVTGH